MLAVAAMELLAMLFLTAQVLRFRRAVPRLETEADMRRFKRLATVQMYVSLFVIPLQFVPFILGMIGVLFVEGFGWRDLLLYAVLPFAVLFTLAALSIGLFRAVRATPTANPTLEAERAHVADVWVNRNFPDW
jgi:hypothetical protein